MAKDDAQRPLPTKAAKLIGWELHETDRGAALVLGVEMQDAQGNKKAIGQHPLLLSVELCRQLAAQLIEISDRLSGPSGRA